MDMIENGWYGARRRRCILRLLLCLVCMLGSANGDDFYDIPLSGFHLECSETAVTVSNQWYKDYNKGIYNLSVDWGENPSTFQYETVSLNFYNGSVVADDTLHQSEDELHESGTFTIDGRQLSIHHRYERPGVYSPIFCLHVEAANYFSGSRYTCPYQMGDTLVFTPTGNRSDASCMMDSRKVIVIDQIGGCMVSTLSSLKASTTIGADSFVGITITAALVLFAGFGILVYLQYSRQHKKRHTRLLDI